MTTQSPDNLRSNGLAWYELTHYQWNQRTRMAYGAYEARRFNEASVHDDPEVWALYHPYKVAITDRRLNRDNAHLAPRLSNTDVGWMLTSTQRGFLEAACADGGRRHYRSSTRTKAMANVLEAVGLVRCEYRAVPREDRYTGRHTTTQHYVATARGLAVIAELGGIRR
jgi:hypothetical protein